MDTADRSLGGLAVVCDKNMMEASGYAATLAEVMKEKVWLVEFYEYDQDPPVKWIDRVMHIRDEKKGTPPPPDDSVYTVVAKQQITHG